MRQLTDSRTPLILARPAIAWLAIGCFAACSAVVRRVGGDFDRSPATSNEWERSLGSAAQRLVEAAFDGIGAGERVDHHVHLMGSGAAGSGSYVNPRMRSWWHPFEHLRLDVYRSAAGVASDTTADEEYVARLVALVRAMPGSSGGRKCGTFQLLALDYCRDEDGAVDLERTALAVSNDRVFEVCEREPELFEPVVSIHPARPDAIAELERCVARGARMVKWIPAAMDVDPANPRYVPFYEAMARHGVALLTHAGEERAVANDTQDFGNPLRLRVPLDHGVTVVAAHCASLGDDVDLDDPAAPRVASFSLFLRLVDSPKYVGRLFGDLSAVTQYNRCERVLATLLERSDLHPRLVDGSDYPLPAVNFLVRTGQLESLGFLTHEEKLALDEVYRCNPLLFDFVLKRTVHHPTTGARFPAAIFTRRLPDGGSRE